MLDDLNAGFVSCPEDRRKTAAILETTTKTIERQSVDLNEVGTVPKVFDSRTLSNYHFRHKVFPEHSRPTTSEHQQSFR